jgi:hypothetical protein
MAEGAPNREHCQGVQALKAAIEAGLRERLAGLGEPGRVIPRGMPDEYVVRLLIEVAADASTDDEQAIRALQEIMRERGMGARSHKTLTLDLYAVRGISDSD